jgi:hypothetical protein
MTAADSTLGAVWLATDATARATPETPRYDIT